MKEESAATDRDDDFQAVAAGKRRVGMLATGDDFAVFFDGDALSLQIQGLDQLTQGERGREGARGAVDDEFNHNFFPGESFSIMPNSTLKPSEGHEGTSSKRASYSGIT